ncbi:MarR family transcriptional regulator [Lactiplantibacillus sp. WILCCON 0030]|uniref:MarR family transcriptional regulator n=1 Tax=Lactiplantibacillus brownii TaxID=3069269 RepID=A0ABU1ABE8_9LACO|nr:MarR family transcriptional regulator [Lactiplantibacillus brownii]MDQ7938245.1 MarR family transcriptional regulator [Lactiplantibacillus brownii]
MTKYDLTETRFIILMFLLRADDQQLTPAVIATKLGATRATVSKILKRLIANDWVVKTNSVKDKRSVLIQLTSAGEAVLHTFLPHNFEAVKTIMAPFSTSEIATLTKLLHKVNQGSQKSNSEKSH